MSGGARGAAGRQDVVDDQYPLAGPERIGVHLDRGRTVLKLV